MPAMLAVLFAEIGGAMARAQPRRIALIAWVVLAVAAAIGGAIVTPRLTLPPRTLLCGLALVFAAMSQFGRATAQHPILAAIRAPSPFLIFALAARLGAPLTLAGSAAGLALAMFAPPIPHARRIAGALLGLAGAFAALSALRIL